MSNTFLWEDYASEEGDKGVEIQLLHKGQLLPFRVKRHLTIDEKQRATDAGIQIELDMKGVPHIKKQDQAAFMKEVVRIGLVKWPFEYSEGNPVPLNPKTISRLDGTLLSELSSRILGITEVTKEELDPFEKGSEGHSLKVVPADQN